VSEESELESAIKNAENLHGHLGPFLVIGVRMGMIALSTLKLKEKGELQATLRTPLSTPFSCIIDGIQATTKCTVGNQKLRVENSQKEIKARFESANTEKVLSIRVHAETISKLINRLSEGISAEELALKIAHVPEKELFTIEER
jgi:formylmethanofuran dehydrogenase subunit E